MGVSEIISAIRRRGFRPGSPAAFAAAAATVALAAATRALLEAAFPLTLPYATFFAAVALTATYASAAAAAAAIALSIAIVWFFFEAPFYSFAGLRAHHFVNAALFAAVSAIMIAMAEVARQAVRQARAEGKRRDLILQEVEHRAKNMYAIGAAIVHYSLKEDRATADLINARMRALALANNLITQSETMKVSLRQILDQEIMPYGPARFDIRCDDIVLRSDAARTFALLLHELTTNAAKYGALSAKEGRVAFEASAENGAVRMRWSESGGPPAEEPSRTGFGTKLIETTLKQFDGTIERRFGPNGFSCEIEFRRS